MGGKKRRFFKKRKTNEKWEKKPAREVKKTCPNRTPRRKENKKNEEGKREKKRKKRKKEKTKVKVAEIL